VIWCKINFILSYDEDVTNEKVQKFRKMLIEREGLYDKTEIDYDEFGRPV
jgi:hypothetical protein